MISDGTTGLTTWTAAHSLMRWLLERPQVLKGHVLELGSGAGFTGIALAKLGLLKGRLTLSDHHRLVLEALAKNVELNLTSKMGWTCHSRNGGFLIDHTFVKSNCSVCVENLDWDMFTDINAEQLGPGEYCVKLLIVISRLYIQWDLNYWTSPEFE